LLEVILVLTCDVVSKFQSTGNCATPGRFADPPLRPKPFFNTCLFSSVLKFYRRLKCWIFAGLPQLIAPPQAPWLLSSAKSLPSATNS